MTSETNTYSLKKINSDTCEILAGIFFHRLHLTFAGIVDKPESFSVALPGAHVAACRRREAAPVASAPPLRDDGAAILSFDSWFARPPRICCVENMLP